MNSSTDHNRHKTRRSNATAVGIIKNNKKSRSTVPNHHHPLNSAPISKQVKSRPIGSGPGGGGGGKVKLQKQAVLRKVGGAPAVNRAKTCGVGQLKTVHFSDIVDRFHPGGGPTSQILLAKQESSDIELRKENSDALPTSTSATADTSNVDDDSNSNNNCPPLKPPAVIPILSQGSNPVLTHPPKSAVMILNDCDFEFMNKSFNYDDESVSVVEFSPEDTPKGRNINKDKCEAGEGCLIRFPDEGDSYQSTTLLSLMKSVLTPLSHQIFGSSDDTHQTNLLSNVTHVGERIFRGVTDVFFCETNTPEEENTILTYNDYSIKTIGRSILVNSVLFGGKPNQKLRVLIEIKEFENPVLDQRQRRTRKPKLVIGMVGARWTLTKRNDKDERSGMLEIKVPTCVPLSKIKIKGPYDGLICINIP